MWVNLVTDGAPAIALSVDLPDPDIMRQKPRLRGQGIFTKPVLTLMTISGLWISLVNLVIFKWALDAGKDMREAQSLVFLTLIIIQLFNAYNFRSEKKSIFVLRLFANKWLNLAVISQIALMLAVFYVPLLQSVFGTYSLSGTEWLLVILVSGTIFPVLEIGKAIIRWQEKKKPTLTPAD